MNTPKIAIAAFSAIALSVFAFSTQAANLVSNGGFETTTGSSTGGQLGYNVTATGWSVPSPTSSPPGSYAFLFTPSATPTTSGTNADNGGVTGQYGNLQLWGPGNGSANGLILSPNGGNFIGADGPYQPGAISQTIAGLTVGATYNVSFYYAAAQQYNYTGSTGSDWTVGLGGSPTQTTALLSIGSKGFSGWHSDTLTFTATSASEVLSFLAGGNGGSSLPPFALLDGVSMTQVTTPIPAALFFVAPALAGVFGFSRRKRTEA